MNFLLLLFACLTLQLTPRYVDRVIDGSGDVPPRAAVQDADHCCLGDSEPCTDVPCGVAATQSADGSHIVVRDFGASGPLTSGLPLFALSVGEVVVVSPDEEMIDIYARSVVARMEHLQPIRDFPSCQEPRNAVRLFDTAIPLKMPVALTVARSHPGEASAIVGRPNLCAKSLRDRLPAAHVARMLSCEDGFAIPPVIGVGLFGVCHREKDTNSPLKSPAVFTLCWSLIVTPGDVFTTIDGDTFRLRPVKVWPGIAAVEERVRVLGIDTPERGQPGYSEATAFTTTWLSQGNFTITACKRDSFGRLLAVVSRNGVSLADALYSAGLGARP